MKFTNTIGRKITVVIMVTILLSLLSCGEDSYKAKLELQQIDFDLDGNVTTNSAWGSAILTYDGSSDIIYFNLAVNNKWVIQNIPVLSHEGKGVTQSIEFTFDLGVPDGTDVTKVEYAFDLDTRVLDLMPGDFQSAPVVDRQIVFYSGIIGGKADIGKPPAQIKGGKVVSSAKHKGKFPNQDCGKAECVPAAVSNSLQFLVERHKLDLGEKKIDIETMKEATGWNNGCGSGWWDKKNEYMKSAGYPITTTVVNNFDQIIKEIERGQDVELGGDAHRAAVVGISKTENGKYSIDITHDTEQGKPGGTVKETTIYDPKTKKFSGGKWLDGTGFINFVVECPS